MTDDLFSLIEDKRRNRLAAYGNEPGDIKEHAGIEETVLAGGYGYRQVLELVQNGADAILEANEQPGSLLQRARIEVVLNDRFLYVANTGAPLSRDGVEALLQSHSSPKRGNQIGRFGLGFKSLLRLGGRLDIFSTSGSLRFDPEACRNEIRTKFGLDDMSPVPGLRLAWALSRNVVEADDEVLAAFRWATTVVRAEIRNPDVRPHLREEIGNFPRQFLLFMPGDLSLTLDVGDGVKRVLRRKSVGTEIVLHDGDSPSRWRVVEHPDVRISDPAAISDATHLHARESVPVSWAIPLDSSRDEAGKFWAFFPTNTLTRLPGILNAPWKLNSDRNALIPGPWNTALMREAAKLVTETLPGFSVGEDPAKPLDLFPRQLDRQDEPAAPLVEAIWEQVKTLALIPDATGLLKPGDELARPPLDEEDLQVQWRHLANEDKRGHWVHPSCLIKERPSRLSELAKRFERLEMREMIARTVQKRPLGRLSRASSPDWFDAIAVTNRASALEVLRLAENYGGKVGPSAWQSERKQLRIIPAESGELCEASELLIAPEQVLIPGQKIVSRDLVRDAEGLRILSQVFLVKSLDETGWADLLQKAIGNSWLALPNEAWEQFWNRVRLAPENVKRQFAAAHGTQIQVRLRDGSWVLAEDALAPGGLVAEDDAENQAVLLDGVFHRDDGDLLTILGVTNFPGGVSQPGTYEQVVGSGSNLLNEWLSHVRAQYRAQLDASRNPQDAKLAPLKISLPNGWKLLARVKGLPNASLTRHLCLAISELPPSVEFGHVTQGQAYQPIKVAHPLGWYVQKHGTVTVGRQDIPVRTALARQDRHMVQQLLREQLVPLNCLDNLPGAPAAQLPSPNGLKQLWLALFDKLATHEAIAGDSLDALWRDAAADDVIPETLHGPCGPVPLEEVFVTSSVGLAERARQQGRVVISLDEATRKKWLKQGAKYLDQEFKPEWDEVVGEVFPLVVAVPEVGEVLSDEGKANALAQAVTRLRLSIGQSAQAIPCLQECGVLYFDPEQLEGLSRANRLKKILEEIHAAGWLEQSLSDALKAIADSQIDELRNKVRTEASLEGRLLMAVGKQPDVLRNALGESASIVPPDLPALDLSRLVLATLGPTTLQNVRPALEAEGLRPPVRWGGEDARAFVAAIGFPEEFASAPEAKRDAEEFISGPIPLGPLHDYQEEVVTGIKALIESGTGRRRIVVSLPTGGGKTRVTVQAAVELVLKPESCSRIVLWVAQTDELCEQAVQSFRQVWLNCGSQSTDLRIIRFWGGHRNPAPPSGGLPTVVVASIQTLNSRIGSSELAWLSKPGLLVIDECHHAIAPSYTGLLRWLDAEAPRLGTPPKDEPPIIGLSATPFRSGADEEESRRLARRFDSKWLPDNQEALHRRLTDKGTLAGADYEPLRSPTIPSPDLADRIKKEYDATGAQLENLLDALNEFLAADEDRNKLLVETIQSTPERSILLFANSVRHAEELALRLNLKGIPAAAVSGDTASAARRYFLDRFQSQEIRVLCNYNVLTTGFDAPKTDMVLIARQVQSPVRYMQMVGRGLRGEKNGGTARCRIVTVLDNLGRFGERHPYPMPLS